MLQIIEPTYDEPVRMLAKPGVLFIPGQVVSTMETEEGDTICDLAQNDNRALGLVGATCYVRGKKVSYQITDMLEVWAQRMIFRSDQYAPGTRFSPGSALYVGKDGWLTSDKPDEEDTPCVARVTMVPDDKHEYFEALWL